MYPTGCVPPKFYGLPKIHKPLIILEPGECLSSYDVSALFTSVPVDPALTIIKDLLEKDTTLEERTVMEVRDIIICLKNTYFSFQDQFYEQVEGAAKSFVMSLLGPDMALKKQEFIYFRWFCLIGCLIL